MPHLTYTARARAGLERCRLFLAGRNEDASRKASRTISDHLDRLEVTPAIGRPVHLATGRRELVIPFGHTGYVALYAHLPEHDEVRILAFRHQREAGY